MTWHRNNKATVFRTKYQADANQSKALETSKVGTCVVCLRGPYSVAVSGNATCPLNPVVPRAEVVTKPLRIRFAVH